MDTPDKSSPVAGKSAGKLTPAPRLRSVSFSEKDVEEWEHQNYDEPLGDQGKEREEEDGALDLASEELGAFLSGLDLAGGADIPDCAERFVDGLARRIATYETGAEKIDWRRDSSSFLALVARLRALVEALSSGKGSGSPLADQAGAVLKRAMSFLEEEFRTILEEQSNCEDEGPEPADRSPMPTAPGSPENAKSVPYEPYPPETAAILGQISKVMTESGYDTECRQVYSIARKAFLEEAISEKMGIERVGIEEVQKMPWDALELEIAKWVRAFRRCLGVYLAGERRLCNSVFSDSTPVSQSLFANLARGVVIHLLNFAEAVAMTRRSTERLFKFLDMYEAFRDGRSLVTELFDSEPCSEIRSGIDSARKRIGEAAVAIFGELESSIQGESAKTPVPGGAVHPLTRYVMNYLKLACEYKETLTEAFEECHPERDESESRSALSVEVLGLMELLDANLEAKSKLYKDQSLSYIFLMNNGRYIVQKVKGSEIYSLLGDDWYRKRSYVMRQYHKNYQRETWGKVLACFRDEGLHVGGGGGGAGRGGNSGPISKPALKERFKVFNAMFEEIHKTQSSWVVSDEQLQSELRVSISAVVIPAYRSFLGRFRQYLEGGRQSDKYLKYGPEDLETLIDELFEGTPASMNKRRG
ncbi:exocyst complex component EXO70B1-like [Nymphaea colorata]|uniref:Exocyst subunit Exo70 family protein n=1 Tax=Nymphaea colorata TaxID=210225 RepID=A0A5K0X7F2_9MAGN|nr:exocyst complex component EXO70B1-like [Nymphaea colorata]